jgi:hypothetical protein
MGYVDVLMSGSSVTALRAVRVLRPLRTITHIRGLRVGASQLHRQAVFEAAVCFAAAVICSNAHTLVVWQCLQQQLRCADAVAVIIMFASPYACYSNCCCAQWI